MEQAETQAPFSLLYVEDDAVACTTLGRVSALQFPHATVYTAGDGLAGLELFKASLPDIVVTDINMPLMDGIEMAAKIKAIKSDTKFIVLTGHGDKIHLERFSEIGYVDYMVKPVDFERLFAAIEKGCEGIARGLKEPHSR